MTRRNALGLVAVVAAALTAQEQKKPGYTDTPMLPGQPWHVHDSGRPHPNHVTPGAVLPDQNLLGPKAFEHRLVAGEGFRTVAAVQLEVGCERLR